MARIEHASRQLICFSLLKERKAAFVDTMPQDGDPAEGEVQAKAHGIMGGHVGLQGSALCIAIDCEPGAGAFSTIHGKHKVTLVRSLDDEVEYEALA